MAVIYGFHDLADAGTFNRLATDVGVDIVNEAITVAMAEHREQMRRLLALFVHPTTAYKTVYKTLPATRNQPLDEYGRPQPIKGWDKYEVGLPLQDSGNAMGQNWKSGIKMTVEQVNDTIEVIQIGDMRWVFDHILGALFASAEYTYWDEEHGDLKVLPLANGDSQVYHVMSGAADASTDNHLLAQAAAISDAANPYPVIEQELIEHPENGTGQIISLIPSNLKGATELLTTFREVRDPNVQEAVTRDVLVGRPNVQVPGKYLGYVDGTFIFEWPRLPSGYIVSVHTGASGRRAPLAERSDEAQALQGGLVEVDENRDFPFYQRNWLRTNGYGGWNRVGAIVYRVGNASYATPTGFTMPMP